MENPLFNLVEYSIDRCVRRSNGAVAEDKSKREELKEYCDLLMSAFLDLDDSSLRGSFADENTLELRVSMEYGQLDVGADDMFGMSQSFQELMQHAKNLIVEPASENKIFFTFVFDGFLKKI